MAHQVPEGVPDRLAVGDTWTWTETHSDYPPDSWAMTVAIVNSAEQIEATASESGSTYTFAIAASTTVNYVAGDYKWTTYATDASGNRYTVEVGTVVVDPDLSAASGAVETRSTAKQTLDAIEASILTDASKTKGSISEGGVAVSWRSYEELIELRDKYAAIVAQEEIEAAIERGESTGAKVLVRFTKS